ncbi:unnamed protein product, partial [Ectocarpus sp. 4 AP-2014]
GVVLRNGFIFSVLYGYSSNFRSTGYMHAYTHTGNTKNDKAHAGVSTDSNRRRQNIKSMTHRSICPKILPHSTHPDPSYTKIEHDLVIQCPPFRTCMTYAIHASKTQEKQKAKSDTPGRDAIYKKRRGHLTGHSTT